MAESDLPPLANSAELVITKALNGVIVQQRCDNRTVFLSDQLVFTELAQFETWFASFFPKRSNPDAR